MEWQTDILGEDFENCSFHAAGADGISRVATLVRHVPKEPYGPPSTVDRPTAARNGAVLFLHCWSDYFFNVELAEFWASKGFDFYALDMHNHGRSLQPDTPGGYVAHLDDYDAELSPAISLIPSGRP